MDIFISSGSITNLFGDFFYPVMLRHKLVANLLAVRKIRNFKGSGTIHLKDI